MSVTQRTAAEPAIARARLAVAAIFFVNGAGIGSWAPHIPFVQERLAIGPATLGAALLAMALGAMVAMPLAGALMARTGSAAVARLTTVGYCLLLPLPMLADSLPMLALGLLLLGIINGAMDVAMNAHGVAVENRLGRPIMASLHGMFSLGGFVGAALAGPGIAWLGTGTHALLAGGLLLLGGLAATRGLLPAATDRGGSGQPVFVLPTGAALLLGGLCFLAMLGEGAMLDWSAIYLRDSVAAGPELAAAGYAAFAAAMAGGRFLGDGLRARASAVAIVRGCALLAAAGLAVALLVGAPLAVLAGFASVGLGMSLLIPVFFTTAGNLPGRPAATSIAAVATLGYTGFIAGPPLIGFVAEAAGLGGALSLVVAACLVVAAGARAVAAPDRSAAVRPHATAALAEPRA